MLGCGVGSGRGRAYWLWSGVVWCWVACCGGLCCWLVSWLCIIAEVLEARIIRSIIIISMFHVRRVFCSVGRLFLHGRRLLMACMCDMAPMKVRYMMLRRLSWCGYVLVVVASHVASVPGVSCVVG